MYAASAGNTKMVAALLFAGFDVNAIDNHGDTPLMYAAS